MRPEALNPLFAEAQSIKGVGPRVVALLKKAFDLPPGISEPRVLDFLWHMPTGVIDRRSEPAVRDAVPGTIATLAVRVLKHRAPPRGNNKAPYRVSCEDETGSIDIVFFRAERSFVERQLPVGEIRFISGRIEAYGDKLQMVHPDYIVAQEDRQTLPMLEPVYPLTAGLSAKVLGKLSRQAIAQVPQVAEWLTPQLLEARKWPTFNEAMNRVHHPEDPTDVSTGGLAWQRLAYDELFAGQLALGLVRASLKSQTGRVVEGDGRIRKRITEALPFDLTGSQREAMAEIEEDLASESRMLRLLQGDVGSGKTVVALLTCAIANEIGAQAAIMAPTEVLARQHLETIEPLAKAAGLRIAVLTGREKGKARDAILAELAAGFIDILIGTHALFQPDVHYKDLAVAIIDEQHRFGVHQRLALQSKGRDGGSTVLAMTATPIPRTLLMTHYGDLDVSRLRDKPAGRKPVDTKAIPTERIEEVIQGLRRAVSAGAQIYWVCPLIESSMVSEMAAAEERQAHLAQVFGDQVGLLHGAMSPAAKDAMMAEFADDKIKILVSTTVIEVGVNVPNASIMVIEHAERFGLAQLHQLRGRIGRGERASSCLLLYAPPLTETARARLSILRESEDGFRIAEEDLKLRGGGEILGTRQSGFPEFRLADLAVHQELLEAARDDTKLILSRDPELADKRGQALRVLLYLFERDSAVANLRSG